MSKYISVTYIIPLIFTTYFLIYMIQIYQNDIVAFDEFVLEKQANYAADAAVEELLFTGHLGQDYNVGDYIAVEPGLGVDEFASILAMDFDFINTKQSQDYVKEHYIKALLVCAYDGIYAYWFQPTESKTGGLTTFRPDIDGHEKEVTTGYGFRGTPKIPYFYTDPNSGVQYCLTLGLTEGYCDKGNITADSYDMVSYGPLEGITEDQARTSINNTVSKILNYALFSSYSAGALKGSGKTYMIPSLGSYVSGRQPVNRITVLGVIEGRSTSLTASILAECIGGAQLEQTDNIVCYIRDRKKLYSKSSYLKENASTSYDPDSVMIVSTVFEAAALGYSDDLSQVKLKD